MPRLFSLLAAFVGCILLLGGCNVHSSPSGFPHLHNVAVALAGLCLPLLFRRSPGQPPDRIPFKLTHALPVTLQLIILFYWSRYFSPLHDYAWYIAFQVLYAYAIDALLEWRRYGRLQFTLAPLPLVLSTNLFVQFHPVSNLQLVIVALAVCSKELFRWRGRHVFNPSAIAITLVGIVQMIFFPSMHGDISANFEFAPLMPVLILLLALVVQSRVPVALISISAATVMMLLRFNVVWPANLLVFTLLATDPATSPRSAVGRVMFGATIGALFAAFTISLNHGGVTDFYGKVACVPVANLLVPFIDRIASRFPEVERALRPSRNWWHIALFATIILLRMWLFPWTARSPI